MNKLMISTAIAGLLVLTVPALAQDRGDDNRGRGGKPAAAAPAARAPAARAPAPAQPARPPLGASNGRGFNPPQSAQNATPPPDRRNDRRPSAQNAPAAQPAPRDAMRGPPPGNAMRGPAPSNAHAPGQDLASFHRNFTAPRRFHAAAYARPAGWYARRWTFGEILPALFWAPQFWLNDYVDFGLEPPPPGTVWVRDGDDALLIDRYTGEIIQVDYSVFY